MSLPCTCADGAGAYCAIHRPVQPAKKAPKRVALTLDDLEAGYDNEKWAGHGYLLVRERAMAKAAGRVTMTGLDARVLAFANAERWSLSDLFDFTDSKNGRWLAESFLHGPESTRERDFKALMGRTR